MGMTPEFWKRFDEINEPYAREIADTFAPLLLELPPERRIDALKLICGIAIVPFNPYVADRLIDSAEVSEPPMGDEKDV